MTTLLEDIRLALRQICRAIGLEGTAAAVVPLVVLGLALNVAALSVTEMVRHGGKAIRHHSALREAARTDFKAIRAVVRSTIKTISNRQKRCVTGQWVENKQKKFTDFHPEGGFDQAAPTPGERCDIKFLGSATQKKMVAVAEC